MMDAMNDCPCCGTQPELKAEGIVCPECFLTLPYHYRSVAKILKAWNTRAEGAPSVPNCVVTRIVKRSK